VEKPSKYLKLKVDFKEEPVSKTAFFE